jgi:hypothetical protein
MGVSVTGFAFLRERTALALRRDAHQVYIWESIPNTVLQLFPKYVQAAFMRRGGRK